MGQKRKHIPNLLWKHRKLKRFSQKFIKRKLKLNSVSVISRWEKGEVMPSGDNLLKLCALYGKDVHDLYPEVFIEAQEEFDVHDREKLSNKPP